MSVTPIHTVRRRAGPQGRVWTAAERFQLDDFIHQGYSYDTIAKRLGRSTNAVLIQRQKQRIGHRTVSGVLSCMDVARLLGLGCPKTVAGWIARGWLPARNARPRRARRAVWRIQELDLWDMLQNRDTWMAWEPARITEPGLRAWATALRRAGRHLPSRVVAERYHVTINVVNAWVREGRLPAVQYGLMYWFWEADLHGFVPPHMQQRTHPFRVDLAEHVRTIQQAAAAGVTVGALAKQYGVSASTISRIVRGVWSPGPVYGPVCTCGCGDKHFSGGLGKRCYMRAYHERRKGGAP